MFYLDKIFEFITLKEILLALIPLICSYFGFQYIKKSRIYFVSENKIKLNDDLASNIEGLSIKYKEKEIENNLIFISGVIVIQLYNDIKPDDIDKEIIIKTVDENAKWKSFEITNTSLDFKPDYCIIGNKIKFKKSLLKKNDFIRFTALIDSKNTEIKISHRIFNFIPGFKYFDSKSKSESKYNIFIILLIIGFFSFLIYKKRETELKYNAYKTYNNPSVFDYDKIYYLNGNKTDLNSKIEQVKIQNKTKLKDFIDKKIQRINILNNENKLNPSDKKTIEILKEQVDFYEKYNNFYNNPYIEISIESDSINRSVLKNNIKDTLIKINDSLDIKFKLNDDYLRRTSIDNENNDSWKDIFLYSILIISSFIFILLCYNYRIFIKLEKIYKDKTTL